MQINRHQVTDIKPGGTADIAQWGQYAVPPMPWDVEINRSLDGATLLAVHLVDDGTDGRRLVVVDQPSPTPNLTAYVCGQPTAAG